ncbi:tyrosine--tRNA ligase [Patescibacteria group bacterium]|nr:tyrosine--tRNA ligase [Patescibacteria group bacterium]
MTRINNQKIEEVLTRGVAEIINKIHLEKRLKSGTKLRVKFGIDPTSSNLHLGHFIPLKKLRQFQNLGHQVIFLIGDFTAMIGDPSARLDKRRPLTKKEIKKNMRDYINQAAKVLNIEKVEVRYNSEWYGRKKADFLMDLSSRFTYARLIERDEFKKRIEKDIDVTMLELLYPLLQGYDSVELKSDLEIGGTDQKFNLLFARKVQKKYNLPQQDIMTLPLLIGTDGERKMSKSYGNYVKITEESSRMFGQLMSIPDILIWHYFKLLTNLSLKEIELIKDKVYKTLLTPKEAKLRLAKEIVSLLHNAKSAQKAEREFERIFKEKKLPSKIPEIKISRKSLNILDLLVKTKLASSKAEAKRLVLQKGVKIDSQIQDDWQKVIQIERGQVVQVGKRKFVRVS